MLTRLGGLLLSAGGLLVALLTVLASRGAAVGIGGTEVNGQYLFAAVALMAGGAAAMAIGGTALVGPGAIRLATAAIAVGLLLVATSFVGGESTGALLAIGGLFITSVGFVALGGALVRSLGAARWIGAVMLAGVVLALVGTLGPHDLQPLALVGISLAMVSIVVFGILGIRTAPGTA